MRCDCCDKLLNDFEATRRSASSGEYLNTCNKCLKGLNIPTVDRPDLNPFEQVNDWDDDDLSILDESDGEEDDF